MRLEAIIRRLRCEDRQRGAALVEYALLIALIAVVCIGAISALGGATDDAYSRVNDGLVVVTTPPPTSPPPTSPPTTRCCD